MQIVQTSLAPHQLLCTSSPLGLGLGQWTDQNLLQAQPSIIDLGTRPVLNQGAARMESPLVLTITKKLCPASMLSGWPHKRATSHFMGRAVSAILPTVFDGYNSFILLLSLLNILFVSPQGKNRTPLGNDDRNFGVRALYVLHVSFSFYWSPCSEVFQWELQWEYRNNDGMLNWTLHQFPPISLCTELIEFYFIHFNPYYPVLHRPSFDRHWKTRLHRSNPWFATLCLAVFAIGSIWSTDLRVLPRDEQSKAEPNWHTAGSLFADAVMEIHHLCSSVLVPASLFEIQTYPVSFGCQESFRHNSY